MASSALSLSERHFLLRHGAVILASRILWALSVMLTVPVILKHLGATGFGIWESLIAVGAMASVFQVVIGGTTLWRISTLHGENDSQEMLRIARVGIGITLCTSAVIAALVWPWGSAFTRQMGIPTELQGTIRWLLPCAVFFNLMNGINQILLAIVAGRQASGRAALIQNGGLILANGLTVLVLMLGADLTALAWGLGATFLFTFLMSFRAASRCCPGLCLLPICPTFADFKSVGPFAGLLALSAFTVLFRDQLDKLLLSANVSNASAAHFAIAQRVTSLVMQVCIVLHVPLTASVAAANAKGEWSRVVSLYATSSRWICLLCGWLTVVICALRGPLFVTWLGHDPREAHTYLWPLLLGTSSAIMLSGAGVAVAKGMGKPGLETTYTLLTLGLTLLTKPIFIHLFGVWGAVFSSAISWSIGAWFLLYWLHRSLPLPKSTARETQGILLATMGMSFFGWWWGSDPSFSMARWSAMQKLAIDGTCITVFYVVVMGCIVFGRQLGQRFLRPLGFPSAPVTSLGKAQP
jgi:O-antigen/teichoic acid export membrane protein